MILHSIVPVPIMQQMFADQADLPLPKAQSVLSLSPTSMVEGVAQGGQFTINRILSTRRLPQSVSWSKYPLPFQPTGRTKLFL